MFPDPIQIFPHEVPTAARSPDSSPPTRDSWSSDWTRGVSTFHIALVGLIFSILMALAGCDRGSHAAESGIAAPKPVAKAASQYKYSAAHEDRASRVSVPHHGSAENGSHYGQPNASGVPKTVHVDGYYRSDGTYVRSHYRSPPRSNPSKPRR